MIKLLSHSTFKFRARLSRCPKHNPLTAHPLSNAYYGQINLHTTKFSTKTKEVVYLKKRTTNPPNSDGGGGGGGGLGVRPPARRRHARARHQPQQSHRALDFNRKESQATTTLVSDIWVRKALRVVLQELTREAPAAGHVKDAVRVEGCRRARRRRRLLVVLLSCLTQSPAIGRTYCAIRNTVQKGLHGPEIILEAEERCNATFLPLSNNVYCTFRYFLLYYYYYIKI